MTDGQELRATSDQMLDLIDRLRVVEQAKRQVDFGTPEFVAHAIEAEQLGRMVFRWAGIQLEMAHASATAVRNGEEKPAPLERVAARPLDRILAAWREAQLRFEIALPGSPEAAAATNDIERLRVEFRQAEEAARGRVAKF